MEETEEFSIDVSNIFKSIQTACDELTQRGQEYLLVTADPVSHSCMKIGSEKGRQFLDVNSEVVINFFSYCFGADLLVDDTSNIVPTNVSQTDQTQPLTSIQTETLPTDINARSQTDGSQTDLTTQSQTDGSQTDLTTQSQTDLSTQPQTDLTTQSQTDISTQPLIGMQTEHEDFKSDIKSTDDESNIKLHLEALPQNQTDLSDQINEVQNTGLSQNSQENTSLDMIECMVTSSSINEATHLMTEMKDSLTTDHNVTKEIDTGLNNSSEENQSDHHLFKDSEISLPLLSNQDQSSTAQQPLIVSSEPAELQNEMKIIDTSQESANVPDFEIQDKANISDISPKNRHILENDTLENVNENSDDVQNATTKTFDDSEKTTTDNQLEQLNSAIEEALEKIHAMPKSESTTRKGNAKDELETNELPSKLNKKKTKTNESPSKVSYQKTKTNKSPSKVSNQKTKTNESSSKVSNQSSKTNETPSKVSNQKAKTSNKVIKQSEVNIPKNEEIVQMTKPTCSICKSTFSRIHSLKGHMLIIHQLDMSTEELQNGVGKTQTTECKQSSPVDKLTTKSPKKRQQNIMIETCENAGIASADNLVELDPGNRIGSNEDAISTVDSVKRSPLAEENPKTKKRKINNRGKNSKNKKIKIEKDYTETSEKSSGTMLNLESTSNIDDTDKQEAKEGGDHVIVLEENHDENVPKQVQDRNKSTDKAYCEICEKYFQRELNLTIHNIRFHPSKIMQQFGMDVTQNVPIKQEIDNYNEYEPYNQETEDLDTTTENQQENIDAFVGDEEEKEPNNLDTLLDPSDRLNEIMENDKIQQHINITEKENKLLISCKYCEFSCEEFHQVMVHIARVHPNLSEDLDMMMSCFYGINMYNKKCDECHMIFRSIASLWNHIVEEHPISVESCSKKKRLRHLIKKYKSKKSFVKCDICKEQFRSVRSLNLHMSIHPEAGKMFNCPQCGQSFSTKPNLTRHFKQIHLDEKRFQCDICGKSMKSKEALKYHRTTHEAEKPKPFQCHICHKSLRKKETLQIHLRQHEGIKPYICEFCGMAFSQNGNRNKHVQLIHNAERNLECHKCGKTFKLQEHLKRHLNMHLIRDGDIQPNKTFQCEYEGCGACYLTAAQLKVHTMSKHTFERPFICGTCGKGFTTKDKLNRHAQTHMEGIYECDICQKRLPSKLGLSMHYKTHQINTDNEFQPQDNYQTVIIPQEHGAPIKVELAHSEPIMIDSLKTDESNEDDQTYYIQTMKPGEGEDHTVQVEDNTILVDPSILESVLGATSDDQTVYYYVTDS